MTHLDQHVFSFAQLSRVRAENPKLQRICGRRAARVPKGEQIMGCGKEAPHAASPNREAQECGKGQSMHFDFEGHVGFNCLKPTVVLLDNRLQSHKVVLMPVSRQRDDVLGEEMFYPED